MNHPKISVIVPVFNSEKYLHRCIDSILAQTFTDFELLLIDDGSKDDSGKICDEYAVKDSRVRVFHKENVGVIPNNVRQRLKQFFTAPRCLCCPDKLNLYADIVFGDPWNIGNITEEGESLVIVNTPKGKEILTLATKNNTLLLNRNCNKEELDTSQHISERKDQIYNRL